MSNAIAHRQVVVISDLHIGDPQNPNLEDFDRDTDFEQLLGEVIPRTVGSAVTLIIAGDFIDFPQVLPELAWHQLGERFGATEEQSYSKVKRVLQGHPQVFASMRRYLDDHGGQIILLPGNHDVDLHWPSVQTAIRKELGGAESPEYVFVEQGVVHERELYVEHGNQYTFDNWFEHWGRPIVDSPDGPRLERPWGTYFMDLVYNDLEELYPFINKGYPHSRMALAALRSFRDEDRVSVAALARLVAFFVTQGKRVIAEHLLLGDMCTDETSTQREAIERILSHVGEDCDPRRIEAITQEALQIVGTDFIAPAGVDKALGLLGRNDEDALARRARTLLEDGDARVVVFGHTHVAIDGAREPLFGSSDSRRAFNTGSWTPSIPLTGGERWSDLKILPWRHDLRYLVIDLEELAATTLRSLPAFRR